MEQLIKISKQSAQYTDDAHGCEPCQDCEYYERIGSRHCSKVEGQIDPGGHCKLYEAGGATKLIDWILA